MLDLIDPDVQEQIDLVSVPMFVIDFTEGREFRIRAINAAYAAVSGLDPREVCGKSPVDVLGHPGMARIVEGRYRAAIASRKPIRYRETQLFSGRPVTFDTVLRCSNAGRGTRVYGTAMPVGAGADLRSDIAFYIALTRTSVGTLNRMAQEMPANRVWSAREIEAAEKLSRAALSSLDDMERATTGDPVDRLETPATVRALCEMSAGDAA